MIHCRMGGPPAGVLRSSAPVSVTTAGLQALAAGLRSTAGSGSALALLVVTGDW